MNFNSHSQEILEKAKNFIYQENLISFFIILLLIQCISLYFEKISDIQMFQPVIVSSIYTYINTELKTGIYIFLMSGIIASVIPFILWHLLNKKINHIWLNTASALLCTLLMDLLGCFSTSAIGYAFSSTVLIPKIGQGFLFSYILAAISAIIFIEIYYAIFGTIFIRKNVESSTHSNKYSPITKPKFTYKQYSQSAV
jgi:hypothetical protein